MCMHYMMDIESHTVIYLRDLLATRAAADPFVTAFLSLLGLRGALARRGVRRLPPRLWHRGADRAAAARRVDANADPPEPAAQAAHRRRRRQRLRDRPLDGRLGGDQALRRDPHDLGRDQRADDADRLLPADPALLASGPAPDAAPGDPGRAAPLRLLPRPGEGADGGQSGAPAGSSAAR